MAIPDEVLAVLDVKFGVLLPHLDERQRRLYLASEVEALGHGGISTVARLAEASESTVARGCDELAAGAEVLGRVRRPGGGRKSAAERDPGLVPALESLIKPHEVGDPVSPLRWTTASLRDLARELTEAGHPVSAPVVGDLLRGLGFSLQGMAKTRAGRHVPDRDAQFRHINAAVERFLGQGLPVVAWTVTLPAPAAAGVPKASRSRPRTTTSWNREPRSPSLMASTTWDATLVG